MGIVDRKVAVVVMAAGESKRFGGCKPLHPLDGSHTLLSQVVTQALGSQIGPVFVVTGRWHDVIEQAQKAGQLDSVPLLYCPDWSKGLGRSIAYATQVMSSDFDAMLILLADQIALRAEDLQRLVESESTDQIVCAFYHEKRGVPALFPASSFAQLQRLDGEHGARQLLRRGDTRVREVPIERAAFDIDTREALNDWQRRMQACQTDG